MSIHLARVLDLPRIQDTRGNLTFIEEDAHVPFAIRRVYYLYDVPGGASRGGHAHHDLQQLLIAVNGTFDVHLDDGREQRVVTLNRSFKGLYMPRMLWRELHNFSGGAVCLCLASEHYLESDYIREHSEFLAVARSEGRLRFVPYDRRILDASRVWLREPEIAQLTLTPSFTDAQQEAWFQALSGRNDYVAFGIEHAGAPVGACGLKNMTSVDAEYFGFLGERSLWGKRLGREMVDAMVVQARLRRLKRVWLKVGAANDRAVRLYAKAGFVQVNDAAGLLTMSLSLP